MKTQVDIKYLAELARTGDDDHRMLVTVVSIVRGWLWRRLFNWFMVRYTQENT